MITCTRLLHFCAGHRLMDHESKCRYLHGHNYKVELTVEAEELDTVGRAIDFTVVKERIGGWIDQHWDHQTILHEDDVELQQSLQFHKVFRLPSNPTAEHMAQYLLHHVCPQELPLNVQAVKVRLWETENCYADATL
jgi:6-pyruvoyltetrahydropterin/6-carboxytetrahydropterin synthase